MPQQFLLAISIGPVQEFIAAGRKTRDLWFGSFLLSEVARATATELQAHGMLIFPDAATLDAKTPVPLPNKLLAILHENEQDPEAIANTLENAANAVLDGLRNELLTGKGRWLDKPLVDRQVETFLEFYAAWRLIDSTEPQEKGESPYSHARQDAERLLAGAKSLRGFVQPVQSHGRTKSALDPSRESVLIPRTGAAGRSALRLKGKEELDAISLIKRTSDKSARFVSTARVAIDPLIYRLANDPAHADDLAALNAICDADGKVIGAELFPANNAGVPHLAHYQAFPYDIQLFYDPGIADATRRGAEAADPDVTNAARAQEFFDNAQQIRRRLGDVPEMPAYFAVVHADGDHMGKLIGQLLQDTHHQVFSEHLSRFSGDVRKATARHYGALIYSGGDDVLAFLPLDQVLSYAAAIRTLFNKHMANMEGALANTFNVQLNGDPPTLSVGIAIGHYAENLGRLLGWAHEAEQYAKAGKPGVFNGRNALAVAYYPRGAGEPSSRAGHNWTDTLLSDRWARWVYFHRHDLLPDGAGYEIRRLAQEFGDFKDPSMNALFRLELKRVLLRKQSGHGADAKLGDDVIKAVLGATGGTAAGMLRLASELIISRNLATAVDTAQGAPARVTTVPPEFAFPSRKETADA